jgi:hypothetical protein
MKPAAHRRFIRLQRSSALFPVFKTLGGRARPRRDGLEPRSFAPIRSWTRRGFSYHFYILGADGEILDTVDCDFHDDGTAMAHADALVARGDSVEVLRGALVLGQVRRAPGDSPACITSRPPPRGWFPVAR